MDLKTNNEHLRSQLEVPAINPPAAGEKRSPALVALVHIFTAVAAHSRVSGHGSTAAWTLQGLGGGLVVLVKIGKLDHQVGGDDGQREVDFHLGLSRSQLNFLCFVPACRPKVDKKDQDYN